MSTNFNTYSGWCSQGRVVKSGSKSNVKNYRGRTLFHINQTVKVYDGPYVPKEKEDGKPGELSVMND